MIPHNDPQAVTQPKHIDGAELLRLEQAENLVNTLHINPTVSIFKETVSLQLFER